MDNVIQNININDIIPMENNINDIELNQLVNSIKKYGIIEPILIRPLNGKYEIILGNKIYQAAKKAGISTLPAIVKDIDDNLIKEYRTISSMSQDTDEKNHKINQYIDSNQKEINSSDIIGLSELNKEEKEREDVKMNNNQMNNVMNNNIGGNNPINQGAEPTFGGKFFPSLEDEPTNMNMGGININPNMDQPATVNEAQPNLIDLTGNTEPAPMPQMDNLTSSASEPVAPQSTEMPTAPQMDSFNPDMNMNQPFINNNMGMPEPIQNPEVGNTINIENLSSEYDAVPQMDLNNTQAPETTQNQINNMDPTPQFDMSQAIDPNPMMSPDIGLGINGNTVDPTPNMDQPVYNPSQDMNINQPTYNEPMMPTPNMMEQPKNNMVDTSITPPTPDLNVSPLPQMDNFNPDMNMNNDNIVQQDNVNIPSSKDITPVINTIKGVTENLKSFGYEINILDEELPTSYKITIEIEK